MTELRIARTLALPLDAITEPFGILGNRGQGKTNTAVVFVEELLEQGQQTVIVDPTDVWWGLKSSKDGKRAGYPVVVLGGKKQDLPLSSGDGKTLADFVVAKRASVILSTRHFESKTQETTFLNAFFRRLYYLKGQEDAPRPVSLILDECSRYIPQRVMGEDAACVGAVQQIVRQGRSSGLGVVLIDQRPATVNKDVLDLVETLIVHRVTGPKNRKAVTEWVEQHDEGDHRKEFLSTLAALERGEAWVWSPGYLGIFQRVKMRERRTFDSSYTPKVGETRIAPTKLADIDLEALRTELAATIAKAQADDPKVLRRRIADLEAARPKVAIVHADTEAIERARALGRDEGYRAGYQQGADMVAAQLHDVHREAATAQRGIEAVLRAVGEIQMAVQHSTQARGDVQLDTQKGTGANSRVDSTRGQQARSTTGPRVPPPAPAPPRAEGVSGVGQRILDTIRGLEALGVREPDKATVAALVGYHPNAKSYANAMGTLNTSGRVQYLPGGRVTLTAAGREIAQSQLHIRDLNELHALWFDRLGNVAQRILTPLLERYPEAVNAAAVAEAAGYHPNAKSFANMKGRLRTLGLIDYPAPGQMAATKVLFPEGLV